MGGCYGNSSEDRHFEGVLMRHLDDLDNIICPVCFFKGNEDDFAPEDIEEHEYMCPECGHNWR